MMHFSSNSSNQSDHSLPDKIAKLEARLTGKTASSAKPQQQQQQLSVWSSTSSAAVKVVASAPAGLSEASISDSDDEVAFTCLYKKLFRFLCLRVEKRGFIDSIPVVANALIISLLVSIGLCLTKK